MIYGLYNKNLNERQFFVTLHMGLVLLRTNRSLSFVNQMKNEKKNTHAHKITWMFVNIRFSIYVCSIVFSFFFSSSLFRYIYLFILYDKKTAGVKWNWGRKKEKTVERKENLFYFKNSRFISFTMQKCLTRTPTISLSVDWNCNKFFEVSVHNFIARRECDANFSGKNSEIKRYIWYT